eukprot:TRINITY_DN68038_c4_g1_i3.p1 TRINITY_DN68038_c4_g1~~TRINITY_DN68038_c4_g1_i3.p1  ORF type:complete len:588 (+),score=52.53 TRINITY_DN68038_c4_g1_i3:168-1766(+)
MQVPCREIEGIQLPLSEKQLLDFYNQNVIGWISGKTATTGEGAPTLMANGIYWEMLNGFLLKRYNEFSNTADGASFALEQPHNEVHLSQAIAVQGNRTPTELGENFYKLLKIIAQLQSEAAVQAVANLKTSIESLEKKKQEAKERGEAFKFDNVLLGKTVLLSGMTSQATPQLPGTTAPDMGQNEWAAFDPIFFFHHCNVDRLWWVWQTAHVKSNWIVWDTLGTKPYAPGTAVGTQGATPWVYNETPQLPLGEQTPLVPFAKTGAETPNEYTTFKQMSQYPLWHYCDGSFEVGSDGVAAWTQNINRKLSETPTYNWLTLKNIDTTVAFGSFTIVVYATRAASAENLKELLDHPESLVQPGARPVPGSEATVNTELIGTRGVLTRVRPATCGNCMRRKGVYKTFLPLDTAMLRMGGAPFLIVTVQAQYSNKFPIWSFNLVFWKKEGTQPVAQLSFLKNNPDAGKEPLKGIVAKLAEQPMRARVQLNYRSVPSDLYDDEYDVELTDCKLPPSATPLPPTEPEICKQTLDKACCM